MGLADREQGRDRGARAFQRDATLQELGGVGMMECMYGLVIAVVLELKFAMGVESRCSIEVEQKRFSG